jgi:hypothetical protein
VINRIQQFYVQVAMKSWRRPSRLPWRETFIDGAPVANVPQRSWELVVRWQKNTESLLELAVAHELGHVPCNQTSEMKTNHAARTMLDGKPLSREVRLTTKTR